MEKQTLQLKQIQYLDKVVVLKIFTPDQCAKIIDNALNTWNEKQPMLQQTTSEKKEQNFVEDLDYRNTTMFSPPKPDDWLFSTILGHIKKFNDSENGYQFDISGMIESPNMMERIKDYLFLVVVECSFLDQTLFETLHLHNHHSGKE